MLVGEVAADMGRLSSETSDMFNSLVYQWSSLDAGRGDAFDEPALEDEEDDQDGHNHNGLPGHEHAVVGYELLIVGKQRQRHRQRVVVLGLGDHERPQEVVPAAEEGEDPECGPV